MEKGFQLRNYHIRRGSRPKDSTPIYPITKAENVIGGAGGVTQVTELPTTGEEGKIYYNTTDKKYYLYNGTSYSPIGSTGANGKSAYDIAVDEGFDGDEATWLASLKGDKGDKGDTGNAGPKGDKGDTGATGTQGPAGSDGADGSTPHIDALTGNWFIGDTDTQVKAQGPKGDSGVASGDGVVVVNDTSGEPAEITEGQVAVLGAGVGKYIADRAIPTAGTFADAYDKAKANSSVVFPWMLIDEDESGEPVKKMIWHVGNKKFIDAIGSEIDGTKNGLTVVVSQACDMVINGNTIPLVAGENNFTAAELGLVNNGVTSNITPEIYIYQSGTETEAKSLLTYLDFGGLTLQLSTTRVMSGFTGLTKLKRCDIKATSYFTYIFQNCSSLKEATMTGTVSNVGYWGFFPSCTLLETADLSGLSVAGGSNTNTPSTLFLNCSALKSADVRSFNMSAVKYWSSILNGCSSLKRLDIGGNFSNEGMTSKGTALSGVTGADLFIHSTTPPVLKNCTFTDNTANDEHGLTYDWLSYTDDDVEACHFRAIYVPDEAVDTYKEDVYVSGGTEGNTGWSYYADIIKGMSEYVE